MSEVDWETDLYNSVSSEEQFLINEAAIHGRDVRYGYDGEMLDD